MVKGATFQGGDKKLLGVQGGDGDGRVAARNVEGTVDITEFFWKLKFVCHWADPSKDLKWSNVPGVKLSSLSKSDDTFLSLQTLSNLHYLFSGFIDYLWSCELDISNFGPADRKILLVESGCETTVTIRDDRYRFSTLMFSSLIASVWASRIWHLLQRLLFQDDNESHNRNLRAILANGVASCSTHSDQGYVEGFYDQ
ncbi:hypothetical protein Tco_0996265 [Tanacetum coccineum]